MVKPSLEARLAQISSQLNSSSSQTARKPAHLKKSSFINHIGVTSNYFKQDHKLEHGQLQDMDRILE